MKNEIKQISDDLNNGIITEKETHIRLMKMLNIDENSVELLKEITRLQEKYDENGYGCSPIVKLQRIEQHIDTALKIWEDNNNKS